MAAHFQTARGRFVVVNGSFPKGSGPARDNSRVGKGRPRPNRVFMVPMFGKAW